MSKLEVLQVCKSFNGVPILQNINFSVKRGEIHALIGANGAGKSTLMKILAGDYEKDAGELWIDGRKVHFTSPEDALQHGVGMVVQEVDTALVPTLSVTENVLLPFLTSASMLIRPTQWNKRAAQHLDEVGASIQVTKQVSECTIYEKQLILLARAVAQRTNYLILDEPTAPLSSYETEKLFEVISHLKENGVGIIFISHRLNEVKRLADRVTILRDGTVVQTASTSQLSIEEMIEKMVGKVVGHKRKTKEKKKEVLLSIDDLFVPSTSQTVQLSVHQGEVVCVVGLIGAGKSETARAIVGADRAVGSIQLYGNTYTFSSPADAIRSGICLVPEERRKEGIWIDESVIQNLSIPQLAYEKKWVIPTLKEKEAITIIEKLRIRAASLYEPLRYLSGGNQQKVAIGKWLSIPASVYVFDEPTKGIDIGSKEEVFRIIEELAQNGKGILYFTSDVDEAFAIADRILIMQDGVIKNELLPSEIDVPTLTKAVSGGI
jgi:simple sugar transport system ATP-binding protein